MLSRNAISFFCLALLLASSVAVPFMGIPGYPPAAAAPTTTPSPGIPPAIADFISSKLSSKVAPIAGVPSPVGVAGIPAAKAAAITIPPPGIPPAVATFVKSIIDANKVV